ncbi:lamin tail domain-containing protein [Bacteroidota bacterium]
MKKYPIFIIVLSFVIFSISAKEKNIHYPNNRILQSNQAESNVNLSVSQNKSDVAIKIPRLNEPYISVERGFYTEPFIVTISSDAIGTAVLYTLDGSDPRTSTSSIIKSQPAEILIDPDSTDFRGKTPAVTLRACVAKSGFLPSKVITHTYLFIHKVKEQTYPGYEWPEPYSGSQRQMIDYDMDQDVVDDSRYSNMIDVALMDLPVVSLVTDNNSLFHRDSGIYVNPFGDTRFWERNVSIEFFEKDGTPMFQIDGGLRIRGGWSRHEDNPKHAFRLFFRNEYGKEKLEYPLFGDEGANTFDNLDLRCAQNYSWSYKGSGGNDSGDKNTMVREVFSRDLQREMGQPYTRSRYYHLYLNGVYWGLFQSQERPEASFGETYFGGNKLSYDVIKNDRRDGNPSGEGIARATDGTLEAYERLYTIATEGFETNDNYFRAQGFNTNGQKQYEYERLLDVENLIDYMITVYFTGDFDAPISNFMGNRGVNNFYCIYNRDEPDGFKFFRHDAEHTMFNLEENRTGPYPAGDNFDFFNPQWLHQQLVSNEEYLIKFADHVSKHFSKGGIIHPDNSIPLITKRINTIDTAIIAESARWGDSKVSTPRTKDDDWQPAIDYLLDTYLPLRPAIVLQQFRDKGWIPNIDAPDFYQNNNLIIEEEIYAASSVSIEISNPNSTGTIYYTLDGTDPRASGGDISENAINIASNAEIIISKTSILKARIKTNNEWSPIEELTVLLEENYDGLIVTEINYNPLPLNESTIGDYTEFIELKNNGSSDINLTMCSFVDGINYKFKKETELSPGEYLVLTSNAVEFYELYETAAYDEYNGKLDNAGERITLVSPQGDTILTLRYNDRLPWPLTADGQGFSIVPVNENAISDYYLSENWRASGSLFGSPGELDISAGILPVYISEILSNSAIPDVDAIELYNPNNIDVNIGNWYLTDNFDYPVKYTIPENTIIPANGYLTLYEGYYVDTVLNYNTDDFGASFSLSSYGEEVYIFSSDELKNLTGYAYGFNYDASEEGVTIGSYITSENDKHFIRLASETFDGQNDDPLVGPIVVNKIMYNPDNAFEFVELINISNESISLFDTDTNWRIRGLDFNFENGVTIDQNDTIYLLSNNDDVEEFRYIYGINSSTQVFQYKGRLNNDGEDLTILKPLEEQIIDTLECYIPIEKVEYNDNNSWPLADGTGNFLERINKEEYANDPINWMAAGSTINILAELNVGIEGIYFYSKVRPMGITGEYSWESIESGLPNGINFNNETGEFQGIPSESGEYQFNIQMNYNTNNSIVRLLSLNIDPNESPIAMDDYDSTTMNKEKTINVLSNDLDKGDKYAWLLSVIDEPNNGTIQINEHNLSITYTPDINYAGSDTFSYEVINSQGKDTADVFIEIIPFNQTDFESLAALYNATNGDSWRDKTGWNTEINNVSNEWFGVEVNNGRVVGLFLSGNNLSGSIPEEIGNLTELRYLWIDNNSISGTLPGEIGNLKNLIEFGFYFNDFSGELPEEIGELTQLQVLIAAWNDFEGEIPESIGNLTQLAALYLMDNNFVGDLPEGIAQLPVLNTLWINLNNFTGIPDLSGLDLAAPSNDNYSGLNVSYNDLSFIDLEPSINVLEQVWQYSPQNAIEVENTEYILDPGDELLLSIEVEGEDNKYQWFNGSESMTEKNNFSEFYIESFTADDVGNYQCYITNDILPSLTLKSIFIEIDITTSITNESVDDIYIYSYNNEVFVEINNQNELTSQVEIFDVFGKKLYNSLHNEEIIHLNVNYPSGIYLIRVKTNNEIITKKVMIIQP